MALQATPYKVEMSLSDMDRGRYENCRFTMARHPSETGERLLSRILAYALWYEDSLEFGRGLSDTEDPALWYKSLDGRILHWIDVGQPDADRLLRASRKAERVDVLAYGNTSIWLEKTLDKLSFVKGLGIAVIPRNALDSLTENLDRSLSLSVMISEGSLFVSNHGGQQEVPLHWALGDRDRADD